MSDPAKNHRRVLAIAPSTRGFGFAVLEGPDGLVDWGVRCTRRNKNADGLAKVNELISHYAPDVIALEDCSAKDSRRSPRVRRFIASVATRAAESGIKTRLISRERVRKTFSRFGAITKHQIATVIAARFPELAPLVPRFRKAWMSEDSRMQVFEAVGMGLVA